VLGVKHVVIGLIKGTKFVRKLKRLSLLFLTIMLTAWDAKEDDASMPAVTVTFDGEYNPSFTGSGVAISEPHSSLSYRLPLRRMNSFTLKYRTGLLSLMLDVDFQSLLSCFCISISS
jgi:hypothetical protein